MPALTPFVDQHTRLQNTLENALKDARFVASRSEGERRLVLDIKRGGRPAHLGFRGVRSSLDVHAAAGCPLRPGKIRDWVEDEPGVLDDARRGFWRILGFLLAPLRTHREPGPIGAWRVTIQAGDSVIEVVCEDAEWWED